MVRTSVLILGLLLVGLALSVVVYQVNNYTDVHTKILPSHQLINQVDLLVNKDVGLPDLAASPEEDQVIMQLEQLGMRNTARALHLQNTANRDEAAGLNSRRKQLDGEIFKLKIEKSRLDGLRKTLERDMNALAQEKESLHEEQKELQTKPLRDRPSQAPYRNPLSAQGAGVKHYLKQMSKNLKALPRRTANKTTATLAADRGIVSRKGALLLQTTGPIVAGSGGLVAAPDGVLKKLPLIEDIVKQGHFGYEHGRNGKSSSHWKAQLGHTTAARPVSRKEAPHLISNTVIEFDKKDLWEGLDPKEVVRRWDGILLDGDYILRPFIDVNDKRASGMEGKPQSIEFMSEGAAEERFYQLVTVNHMICADVMRMGNAGDGGWEICVKPPYRPSRDCLVYSFGINNDFSFDDGISNKFGCEVKAFDPSMTVGDHMHSAKVHFFNLGLGAVDGINTRKWQLRTFGSILKRLGHSNRIIDVLKVDIEFHEWDCLKTALDENSLRNVKQFVFEIHTSEVYTVNLQSHKVHFLRWYNVLLGLEKQGFRRYRHHYNPSGQFTSMRTGKRRTCCYELYYVNIRFLK